MASGGEARPGVEALTRTAGQERFSCPSQPRSGAADQYETNCRCADFFPREPRDSRRASPIPRSAGQGLQGALRREAQAAVLPEDGGDLSIRGFRRAIRVGARVRRVSCTHAIDYCIFVAAPQRQAGSEGGKEARRADGRAGGRARWPPPRHAARDAFAPSVALFPRELFARSRRTRDSSLREGEAPPAAPSSPPRPSWLPSPPPGLHRHNKRKKNFRSSHID